MHDDPVATDSAPEPPNPDLAAVRETWDRILHNWPRLQRASVSFAKVDPRLHADELLSDAIADILAKEYLFDASRGPWDKWAVTRIWLARTRKFREFKRHAHNRIRVSGRADEDEEVTIDLALPDGAEGTAARAEARAAGSEVFAEATDAERDALMVLLHGWSPKMVPGGARAVRRSLKSLMAWIGGTDDEKPSR
jgi:hypothetical protein